MSAAFDVIVIFSIYCQFGASGSQIPDAYSVKLIFSLTVTFYFTRSENRTKKPLRSHTTALSKGTIFAKNAYSLQ